MTRHLLGQPFTVHQFHYRASAGDATTQHMLFLRDAFADIGIKGKIFAVEKKNLPQGKVQTWSLDSSWDCDLFLIHHSEGNPILNQILQMEVPSAFVYHSPPPESFYDHDPEAKNRVRLGKKQLSTFREREIPAYATSQHVVNELSQLGFEKPSLLPLFHLSSQKKTRELTKMDEPKNILFVGRLAPHKRQAHLIQTFFHMRSVLPAHSKLFLVGTGDPLYIKYLKLLIQQLDLKSSVVLTGKVTDNDLQHYFSIADAFVGASAHEGLCSTFVEAMLQDIPVFYQGVPGAKETMGKSGIELLTDRPIEIAAIVSTFMNQPKMLISVIHNQRERIKALAQTQNKALIQEHFLEKCSAIRRLPLTTNRYLSVDESTHPT
ncbi:MAG: glycosyltransferase [Proteobacteria bacterium]|nr:glycosyltransferase [Pseudomonadota bacterium]NDC23148.1 glycosyltransferase [Pseudomonadota bacterium]NDD04359.1 glycosyltransferase [Pseudomonadota bacterium]NDG27446.1 glycosyltransferase [Pseudomonadota bacterium]